MRLLHTSDWHLGRDLHRVSLLDAQATALEALADVARSERVDVVVVAGDVFDRAVPPVEPLRVCEEGLCALRSSGARVVGISGNHDSSRRLGFGERLLSEAGVTLRGDPARAGMPVVIPSTDAGSDLVLYPIPYLEPALAGRALDRPEARSHAAVLTAACDRARADLGARGPARSVVVAHAFVAGGTRSDSERELAVGGAAEVAPSVFDGFDYVALGHLHRAQTFSSGRVRYSGSPLAYSFSERAHTKQAWLVDIDPYGAVHAESVPLPVPRPLAQVDGTLDELCRAPQWADAEQAWVQAIVRDPVLPREPMARLANRFPHVLTMLHRPDRAPSDDGPSYRARVRGRSDIDLASDFLAHVRGGPADAPDVALLREAFDAGRAGATV